MRVHDNEIIMEMRVFWRWVLLEMHLEMRTFKDAFVVAVASFFLTFFFFPYLCQFCGGAGSSWLVQIGRMAGGNSLAFRVDRQDEWDGTQTAILHYLRRLDRCVPYGRAQKIPARKGF